MFEKWNGMECVECGSCSFILPGKETACTVHQDNEKDDYRRKKKEIT